MGSGLVTVRKAKCEIPDEPDCSRSDGSLKQLLFAVFLAILVLNSAFVFAQPQPDPMNDCTDSNGLNASCDPYMDITQSELTGNYAVKIIVADNMPSQLGDKSIVIEWDLMVDADRNSLTSPWGSSTTAFGQLVANGIGVDYMIRYTLQGIAQVGQVFDGPSKTYHNTPFQISGNQITLTFLPSDIGGSTNFYFTILVRKYGGNNYQQLLLFDKAPNSGFYEFKVGSITLVPEFPASQQLLSTVIMAIAVTLFGRRRRAA
jgi:hypothetical protein